jgi:hypothetical protein
MHALRVLLENRDLSLLRASDRRGEILDLLMLGSLVSERGDRYPSVESLASDEQTGARSTEKALHPHRRRT